MLPIITYSQDASELLYITEDARPFNWEEDGEMRGMAVELLKLMWDKMNVPHQKIEILPWARAYIYLQNEPNAVLFSTSRTEHRENLFKWVCPIRVTRYSLVAKKDKKIIIKSLIDAMKYTVGTVRDDVAEQLLIKAGFPLEKIEPVSNMAQNINKIEYGHINQMTFNEESIFRFIKESGKNPEDFETVYVLQETPVCYAFNKSIPDELILQFQNALDQIVETPKYDELVKQFFGE